MLKQLGEYPELLAYELPSRARSDKTGRGQVHYWFVFRLRDDDFKITIPPNSEFCESKWIPLDNLLDLAVGFRKPVYGKLVEYVRQHVPIEPAVPLHPRCGIALLRVSFSPRRKANDARPCLFRTAACAVRMTVPRHRQP